MLIQGLGLACLIFCIVWIYLKMKVCKLPKSNAPCVSIILGSGGHTTQMCELMNKFNYTECAKIDVIIGSTDKLSESFFIKYLTEQNQVKQFENFHFFKTRRTNQVLQSKITSIFSTLISTFYALALTERKLLATSHLIGNGPGLCVPFYLIFWVLNKLKITKTKLIFIESWCRVTSLSTTGRILGGIADEYLVHWPQQAALSRYAKYYSQIL